MSFNTTNPNTGSENTKPDVDYNGLNKHVLEAYGDTTIRNIAGTVSTVIDLGVQQLEDAEVEFTGSSEDEAKAVEDKPDTYFKDGDDGKRYKCWPQKPCQMIALTVDFPQIVVDKGQFFGNSNPQPYRMLLNNEWRFTKEDGNGKELRVNRPFELRENTKLGVWSLNPSGVLYKMAQAAGLLNDDKSFKPSQVDQLVGQSFQFQTDVSAFINGEKTYINERIKFNGPLAEGVTPAPLDDSLKAVIQFTTDNDPEAIKNLRASIKNTIRLASNFAGSKLSSQLGEAPKEVSTQDASSPPPEGAAPKEVATEGDNKDTAKEQAAPAAVVPAEVKEEWDDDVPF